jgi:hypothetical protein
MNKFTRMLLIIFITIVGSGTVSGFDRLDRFMERESRKLEKRNKRINKQCPYRQETKTKTFWRN